MLYTVIKGMSGILRRQSREKISHLWLFRNNGKVKRNEDYKQDGGRGADT